MSGFVGYQSINKVKELAKPLSREIPAAAAELEHASHLFNEAQLIRYYDEVLTQSARNFAFTQEEKWADRYGDMEPLLDQSIKRAIGVGDETDRQFFAQVDSANLALVEMEYRAISLVDQGRASEAVSILESDEYWAQKQFYWNGLKSFFDRVEVRDHQAHDVSTRTVEAATALARSGVESSLRSIWILMGVLSVAAVVIGTVIGRSIIRPLNRLRKTAIEIAEGNYSARTNIVAGDEIGDLAGSIDQIAISLDNAKEDGAASKRQLVDRH